MEIGTSIRFSFRLVAVTRMSSTPVTPGAVCSAAGGALLCARSCAKAGMCKTEATVAVMDDRYADVSYASLLSLTGSRRLLPRFCVPKIRVAHEETRSEERRVGKECVSRLK